MMAEIPTPDDLAGLRMPDHDPRALRLYARVAQERGDEDTARVFKNCAEAIDRLTSQRDAAMAQVEAYREEDAEWNEGWTALEAELDAALAQVARMREALERGK